MSSDYLSTLEYTLSVTAPIFLIVFLGLYLKRKKYINDEFISIASKLVFNVCLPTLLFLAIINSNVNITQQWQLALFSSMSAIVSFFIVWWLSPIFAKEPHNRGVATQSAFRSNLAIIGIALCTKAYGDTGLAVGALMIAVITPLYNVLSIYALTCSLQAHESLHWRKLLIDIIKNPLIVSIFSAFAVLALDWQLPEIINDTGIYLSRMTLPLALITIGGSLSLTALRQSTGLSSLIVSIKLVILPVIITLTAWLLGFKGIELGCIALMFACPTAAASFVMVRAMGGNHQLASNTIALSTLLSAVTISVLLYLLRISGLA